MENRQINLDTLFPGLTANAFSLRPIFDVFHEGVTITDIDGRVLYMNKAQGQIDDLIVKDAIGKTVAELYRVDEGVSPTLQCLKTGEPVINLAVYYRTHLGRIVNSIHNVYPLFAGDKLYGAILFIKDYTMFNPRVAENELSSLNATSLNSVILVTSKSHKTFDNGTRFTFKDIIGNSGKFMQAVKAAEMASDSPSPIMLYGETGTGKELFAQSIHNHSSRKNSTYVALNCAAIPENLLEGMLFGTTRGSFTGAVDKQGLFEEANGGTLFLDEVNSMPKGLQAKILRVLQERRVRRVGSLKESEIDIKLISSVNEDPRESIEQGVLRPDLMYRLAVVYIAIPPLRERLQDIEILSYYFLHECNRALGKSIKKISPKVAELFQSYRWPGNVRELEHVIEGAANMVQDNDTIQQYHLTVHLAGEFSQKEPRDQFSQQENYEQQERGIDHPKLAGKNDTKRQDLQRNNQDFEREQIIQAVILSEGNASLAARKLGISPQSMHYKLKRYQINAKDYKVVYHST
ncbi:MAG: AAA domain-containing protein [Desulforhopalus sp.]|nr:AAA domain-containing protein [Desulforhopalus sp.]